MTNSINYTLQPQTSLARKNTVVYMGHSYCAYASDTDATFGSATAGITGNAFSYSRSAFEQAMIAMGQPLEVISNQGVSGYTSAQVLTEVPAVLALQPGYVYLQCITNDAFNGVPAATTISNINQIIAALNNAGIMVLFGLDYTRTGFTAAYEANFMAVQNYYKDKARSFPGLIVVDCYDYYTDLSTLTNSQTGVPDSSRMLLESGWYIHSNAFGATQACKAWVKALTPHLPVKQSYNSMNGDGVTVGDTQNVLINGKLIYQAGGYVNTPNTGTCADSTYFYRTRGTGIQAVCNTVTRASVASLFPGLFDDGKTGVLAHFAVSGATAATDTLELSVYPAIGTMLPNDGPYVCECEVGAVSSTGTITRATLRFTTTPTNYIVGTNQNHDDTDTLNVSKYQGVLRTRQFYLPSSVTNTAKNNNFLNFALSTSVGGAADFYVGNFVMRKTTV